MYYKNIYKSRNTYKVTNIINKKSKIFGVYDSLDKAVFIRDLLVKHKWKITEIKKLPPVFRFNDRWVILYIENNKIMMLGDFKTQSSAFKNLDKTIKNYHRNPKNTKYGLYISKRASSYGIVKKMGGKNYSFGHYDKLQDAVLARNLLIEYKWNLNMIKKSGHIVFDDETGQYCVIEIVERKIHTLDRFNTHFEARKNCRKLLDDFNDNFNSSANIVRNGKKFNIYKKINKKRHSYGSFLKLNDAKAVRDILIDCDWDTSKITRERIYSKNRYFWKLIADGDEIKIIGKYKSLRQAKIDEENLIDKYSLRDSQRHRNIYKNGGKYHIAKRMGGELKSFGVYDTLKEAIEARDRLISNNWIVLENESILNNIEDVINNLGLWAGLIYEAFNMVGECEISFDALKHNEVFDSYRHFSLNKKLGKYLEELAKLKLIRKLPDGNYRKLW